MPTPGATAVNAISVVEAVGDSTYKALVSPSPAGARARASTSITRWARHRQRGKPPTLAVPATAAGQARRTSSAIAVKRARHAPTPSGFVVTSSETRPRALQTLLSDNQAGLVLQFNSGVPITVQGNRDLNGDGTNNDRPLFIGRNSVYLPARWNVDARLSRFVPISGSRRVEVLAEFKNIFNTVQVSSVRRQVNVDTAGNPVIPIAFGTVISSLTEIPANGNDYPGQNVYEQRKFQLGFKLYF
jgi:hypothetical protein